MFRVSGCCKLRTLSVSLWRVLLYIHGVKPQEAVIYLFLKFLTLRQISFNTIKFYVTSFPKKDGLPVNSQIKMSLNQTSSKFLQAIMHILNLRHSVIIFHCFLNSYIFEVTIHKFDLYLSPFEKIF